LSDFFLSDFATDSVDRSDKNAPGRLQTIEMDGIHDMGGMAGFGPVEVEADEPVFHQPWEGRVFAMAPAAMVAGCFTTPMFRHAIERMDPVHYLTSGYYEHWLTSVATLLVESGRVTRAELESAAGSFPLARPERPLSVVLDGPASHRFVVGDVVRVRDVHPSGHTRCPDYVRGCKGTVARVDPPSSVPDTEAHDLGAVSETAYGVRFEAAELWGEADDVEGSVHIDLHDRYLEPA